MKKLLKFAYTGVWCDCDWENIETITHMYGGAIVAYSYVQRCKKCKVIRKFKIG